MFDKTEILLKATSTDERFTFWMSKLKRRFNVRGFIGSVLVSFQSLIRTCRGRNKKILNFHEFAIFNQSILAPYRPYGPWNKNGPAKFLTPKADFLKDVFPTSRNKKRNDLSTKSWLKQPMGKLAPWPLSKWILSIRWATLRSMSSLWSLQESRTFRMLGLQIMARILSTGNSRPTLLAAKKKRTTTLYTMSSTTVSSL